MPDGWVDLRSDTVTKPTPAMRRAMAEADVGDDAYGEDPTVRRLEETYADLVGKEAALYVPSGTMANQLALRLLARPGTTIVAGRTSHIAAFENAAAGAVNAQLVTVDDRSGELSAVEVGGLVEATAHHWPTPSVVCVEDTHMYAGGVPWSLPSLQAVAGVGLPVHLDGARLFNACIAQGYSPARVCRNVDTISICFSKGLGCPMGSILVGPAEAVYHARRSRKIFGGALRQAGIVAAAAIYALENHVDRLAEDHENARAFAEAIARVDGIVIDPSEVETNLVFFEVEPELGLASQLSAALAQRGVRIGAAGPQRLRACTHLDVTRDDVLHAAEILQECIEAGFRELAGSATGPYARA